MVHASDKNLLGPMLLESLPWGIRRNFSFLEYHYRVGQNKFHTKIRLVPHVLRFFTLGDQAKF
jgi:hypothetical protein